ncbi:MAG: hypothetical protein VCF07_03490 [Nitrospinota bacterium]
MDSRRGQGGKAITASAGRASASGWNSTKAATRGPAAPPRSVRFIDLEPIEPLQARPVQGEDADPVQAKTFRGNIINIQI